MWSAAAMPGRRGVRGPEGRQQDGGEPRPGVVDEPGRERRRHGPEAHDGRRGALDALGGGELCDGRAVAVQVRVQVVPQVADVVGERRPSLEARERKEGQVGRAPWIDDTIVGPAHTRPSAARSLRIRRGTLRRAHSSHRRLDPSSTSAPRAPGVGASAL